MVFVAIINRMLRDYLGLVIEAKELTVEPSVMINDVLEGIQELKSGAIVWPTRVRHLIKSKEAVRVDKQLCIAVIYCNLSHI